MNKIPFTVKLSSIQVFTFTLLLLLGIESSISLELGLSFDSSIFLSDDPMTELPFEH